jgi:hypothetical protein
VTDPTLPSFVQFWRVDYNTLLQRDSYDKRFEKPLTCRWREFNWPPPPCNPVYDWLQQVRWNTEAPTSYPIEPSEGVCPPASFWTSTPLPTINCHSGRYTLRLTVEDTSGDVKHDLQQVWFDNKDIYCKIFQIGDVPSCDSINLSKFAMGGNCSVPWEANLMGIAYDEYIEEGNTTEPSDNFDYYTLQIKKDGSSYHDIPILGPGGPGTWTKGYGTSRVGEPGPVRPDGKPGRCLNASPPSGLIPATQPGILAFLDFRRLDAVCNPSEPDLTLDRTIVGPDGKIIRQGECCGYIIRLEVRDKSICPSSPAGHHWTHDEFPFFICNDLIRQP